MQVICPQCSAKYSLSPKQVGLKGRTVRCVKCGNKWFQSPVREAEPMESSPPLPPENAQLAKSIENSVAQAKAQMKHTMLISLFSGVIALLLIFSGLVLMKDAVIRTMPAMAGFYQAIGLAGGGMGEAAVSVTGLVIPNDEIERSLDETASQTVLTFKGKVVNTNSVTVAVPELKVMILDDRGVELDSWRVRIKQTHLKPNESATWICRFFNPPLDRIAEHKVIFVERR